MKIVIIGTYPPRQCGIATFTHDFYKSIHALCEDRPKIVAVSDGSETVFPAEVRFVIDRNDVNSYRRAAQLINTEFDIVVLQHEYGIFGGDAGGHIVDLARVLSIPLVTNFHTVLRTPQEKEHEVLRSLASLSKQVTVMTESGTDLLVGVYRVDKKKINMIPHGVPNFPYSQEEAKRSLGLEHHKVMLSFGFLGPGKGFETAIDALASVPQADFRYVILGTTHPNILHAEGEQYLKSLIQRARELGVLDRIQFINKFVEEQQLVKYLCACDIYVTPYPNENQISSGTLSFAIGAGAAVLSTPYWYAKDLLRNNRGLLFDFKDSGALSALINQLLAQPRLMARYRRNAAQYGKRMTWSRIGELYLVFLEKLIGQSQKDDSPRERPVPPFVKNISARLGSSGQKLSF